MGVLVAKRRDSRYEPGLHSWAWQKMVKNAHRSKTVNVLAMTYANGSPTGSINARFQKGLDRIVVPPAAISGECGCRETSVSRHLGTDLGRRAGMVMGGYSTRCEERSFSNAEFSGVWAYNPKLPGLPLRPEVLLPARPPTPPRFPRWSAACLGVAAEALPGT